jgi:hypothetical protein
MCLDLPSNGGSISCSVLDYPEDGVLAFIPEGIETSDHDDELNLEATISLGELKELRHQDSEAGHYPTTGLVCLHRDSEERQQQSLLCQLRQLEQEHQPTALDIFFNRKYN